MLQDFDGFLGLPNSAWRMYFFIFTSTQTFPVLSTCEIDRAPGFSIQIKSIFWLTWWIGSNLHQCMVLIKKQACVSTLKGWKNLRRARPYELWTNYSIICTISFLYRLEWAVIWRPMSLLNTYCNFVLYKKLLTKITVVNKRHQSGNFYLINSPRFMRQNASKT